MYLSFKKTLFYTGKNPQDTQANRDYLVRKMSDEIHEIIRVLQLTTYDEEEWDADDITVMKKAQVCKATGDLVLFQISFRIFM